MIQLTAVVLFSLVSFIAEGAIQDDETLEWLDDHDEAIALAKRTGHKVFLEFRCAP